MVKNKIVVAAAIAALQACAAFGQAADEYQDMREAAAVMPPKLLAVLQDEIAKSGLVGAITVCREKAPVMAKNLSEATGMQIRRVSLRNRNPKAVPDAWERSVLEDFDRRALNGENPASLEASATVSENGKQVRRYMKALPTQELCLSCHGTSDMVDPAVAAKLKALYPDDKATGYQLNQIRGAITAKKYL